MCDTKMAQFVSLGSGWEREDAGHEKAEGNLSGFPAAFLFSENELCRKKRSSDG